MISFSVKEGLSDKKLEKKKQRKKAKAKDNSKKILAQFMLQKMDYIEIDKKMTEKIGKKYEEINHKKGDKNEKIFKLIHFKRYVY